MNKKAMYKLSYGLFILTSSVDGQDYGCVINTCQQSANEPNRITISVINKNHTCDVIKSCGKFNVSVLTEAAPFSVYERFGMQSGRDVDKFAGFDSVARSENGLLYLTEYANAFLSATVIESKDLGSHTLFIADVTDGEVLDSAPSATYAYYQSEVKPKPQSAPASGKKSWVCSVCGYIYEGDSLPDDFICPLCKHGAEDFVPMEQLADAKAPAAASTGTKWVCPVCGYVSETPVDKCPICGAAMKEDSGNYTTYAAEHVLGIGKAENVPEDIIQGLRDNFAAECTEVGMYLAMARAACREGYPEIGRYWEKAAYEEAEHAAKFAELLGEVLSASTKENLEARVAAEFGATQGKVDLAKRAKELGLDAIHDTVHEMARDEARHGKALKGLLDRYFN